MKKTYIEPSMNIVNVVATQHLLAGSGVASGSSVGNAYDGNDVSYGRGGGLWDDDED